MGRGGGCVRARVFVCTRLTRHLLSPRSYTPDLESDPFGGDGSLWSFNYFFYNKKLKRIVFFNCRSLSLTAPLQDEEDDDGRSDYPGTDLFTGSAHFDFDMDAVSPVPCAEDAGMAAASDDYM